MKKKILETLAFKEEQLKKVVKLILIEKEKASLKSLEKNEIEINAQIKILRFLLNNNI